jgi:5'-phosphate synthase pdxT subunit
VRRNAYGRQIDSAILEGATKLEGGPLEQVYIRAPRIDRVGPQVEVLAERDGYPVLIRQGKLLAATFHPELSEDTRVHAEFLRLVMKDKNQTLLNRSSGS